MNTSDVVEFDEIQNIFGMVGEMEDTTEGILLGNNNATTGL